MKPSEKTDQFALRVAINSLPRGDLDHALGPNAVLRRIVVDKIRNEYRKIMTRLF